MTEIKFPEHIIVTEQDIDCTQMSAAKQAFAVDFTKSIIERFKASGKSRLVYGIAGPSGSGKSFLSVLAQEIGSQIEPEIEIVPISIDAFHFPNNYLESSTDKDGKNLKTVKGRFDTYDVGAFTSALEEFISGKRIRFPLYSRKLHEAVAGAVAISDKPTLLLVEGLWLLFPRGGWKDVRPLLDRTFYIDDNEQESAARTQARHMLGGRSESDARQHYEQSDLLNRAMVLPTKENADEVLLWPA